MPQLEHQTFTLQNALKAILSQASFAETESLQGGQITMNRLLQLSVMALAAFVIPTLAAQSAKPSFISQFVGTWKEDPSRTDLRGSVPLRFQRNAKGELEELRGPEARPDVQPVIFDGPPWTAQSGTVLSWKQNSPNSFERTAITEGRTIKRRLTISDDAKTLTEVTAGKNDDGKSYADTFVYERASGGRQGLVGTWKAVSYQTDNPGTLRFQSAGSGALKLVSDDGQEQMVALDEKTHPITGPGRIQGMSVAYKQLDDHTIESAQSREGVRTAKSTWSVSADGKTLTISFWSAGPNAPKGPSVTVFTKQ